ncbi:hypothetical protein I9H06_01950 [Pseudomonas tremae]|uniref:hypothetical protein n=1 Tax=Pseudomonas tremae TaxID=200454 RepID=UPI001F2C3D49|nr:hypothetical protein [Pseudomonas tremae]MCF5712091.1 hypothetical protein [Pseudomonas tremae]UQB32096.1 hypothetical protein I9H06_01950 [Pseudomonas tremae]
MNLKNKKIELHKLTKSVRLWQVIVAAYVGFVFLIYFIWFGVLTPGTISHETSEWGEFGDYIGGALNPVLALAAFFWLTKAVRYQKEELIEAAAALQDTSKSGRAQVEAMVNTVKLNAHTALLNSVISEIEQLRSDARFIAGQLTIDHQGKSTIMIITPAGVEMTSEDGRQHLKTMQAQLQQLLTERDCIKEVVKNGETNMPVLSLN